MGGNQEGIHTVTKKFNCATNESHNHTERYEKERKVALGNCSDGILKQNDVYTNTVVHIFVYPRSIGQQF